MMAGRLNLTPRDEAEPVFAEPWEARAFAITMALCQRRLFSYEEFRERLIAEINGTGASDNYYVNWLRALEAMLDRSGALSEAEIRQEIVALQAAAAAAPGSHH
jgi:nitrile hydratase accessory protein